MTGAEEELRGIPTASLKEWLWRRGRLDYLMHAGQAEVSAAFRSFAGRKFVLCCNRRWGKSRWFVLEAIALALRLPRAQIRYAAPTAKQVRTIVEPHMEHVLLDCPEGLRPEFNRQDGIWSFPNGSQIHVVGCDNRGYERLRGVEAHLALVDEAGSVADLDYVVRDILLPQTITTDGKIILASTPPPTPSHDFRKYVVEAEASGSLIRRTIHESPHIRPEQVEEYCRESGGAESSTWRREYLAEFVVDESVAVVPEWSSANIEDVPMPEHLDAYVSMDVGYSDLTVALIAWADFARARIVVEDEVVMRRSTSDDIDAAVREAERRHFGRKEPVLRVVDAPPIVVADLRKGLGRAWLAARKDDSEAALNALRLAVSKLRLVVNPRCRTTIAHFRGAIWNRSRTSFERSDAENLGHFDAVDAAKYLVRHVDLLRNPERKDPREKHADRWVRPDKGENPALLLVRPRRRHARRTP